MRRRSDADEGAIDLSPKKVPAKRNQGSMTLIRGIHAHRTGQHKEPLSNSKAAFDPASRYQTERMASTSLL